MLVCTLSFDSQLSCVFSLIKCIRISQLLSLFPLLLIASSIFPALLDPAPRKHDTLNQQMLKPIYGLDRHLKPTCQAAASSNMSLHTASGHVAAPKSPKADCLAEYFSALKDRQAMFSQFVFVLKIKIKQAFPLLVHMRFLFSSSLPQDTCVIISQMCRPNSPEPNPNKSTQHRMNFSGSQHTGYSHHLQYLDSAKSSAKDLSNPLIEITIRHSSF